MNNIKIKSIFQYAILFVIAACSTAARNAGLPCDKEIATVETSEKIQMQYLRVPCIAAEGWDTLKEIKFWKTIINLSGDSSMANVFGTRKMLQAYPKKSIDSLERRGKLDSFKKEVVKLFHLPEGTRILFTSGKKWFYNFSDVKIRMARAIHIFDSMGVDPFYAQSVLLIESPGGNKQKSSAGAYGHFQLMPFVARHYGLVVNSYRDERENFDKSCVAAAKLFKDNCIFYARKWCENYGFAVNEQSLWFKLLALHNYNAGPMTVKSAMATLSNTNAEGNELIKRIWHTKAGNFSNEAQNYSQLALACYLEFEKQLSTEKHTQIRISTTR